MKFAAAGDMAISRRIHKDSPGFREVKEFLCQADTAALRTLLIG